MIFDKNLNPQQIYPPTPLTVESEGLIAHMLHVGYIYPTNLPNKNQPFM